jgi:hypothetical protein
MRHLIVYFYTDGSSKRHRLVRRYTTMNVIFEERNELRRQALDLHTATCESRIRPSLSDITKLVIFDGHTKIQEIPFTSTVTYGFDQASFSE